MNNATKIQLRSLLMHSGLRIPNSDFNEIIYNNPPYHHRYFRHQNKQISLKSLLKVLLSIKTSDFYTVTYYDTDEHHYVKTKTDIVRLTLDHNMTLKQIIANDFTKTKKD